MFTLVVPTLQRSPYLQPLLESAVAAELVGQVVVVNNHTEPLPFEVPGVTVLAPGRNLFVNPSWNLGVAHATQPRLAICNDDLVFPMPLLEVVADRLDRGAGIVGLDLRCLRVEPEQAAPRLRPAYVREYGFGSLMFLDRESYLPVPDDLLVWCGDDWLFRRQRRRNYRVTGVPVRTSMGTTSTAPEFTATKQRDLRLFREQYADNHYARRFPLGCAVARAGQGVRSLPDRLGRRGRTPTSV